MKVSSVFFLFLFDIVMQRKQRETLNSEQDDLVHRHKAAAPTFYLFLHLSCHLPAIFQFLH